MSMKDVTQLLLTNTEYCHVIDNNTGSIRLVEGPFKGSLQAHEQIYGNKWSKIVLKDNQYIIILNPVNKEKTDVVYGEREIRKGAAMFSLYPGEQIDRSLDGEHIRTDRTAKEVAREETDDDEDLPIFHESWNGVRNAFILKMNKGLLLKAIKDFVDVDENKKEIKHRAGDEWIVQGPIEYIPHKYVIIKKKIKAISIGNHDGIYIKNIQTGAIRLEKGPKNIMLTPDEYLWDKDYTNHEYNAIGFRPDVKRWQAMPLWVLENEATMIMDEKTQRVVIGPTVILLEPFERPYVMSISGGTPKIQNKLNIWKIRLGPDFCSDVLSIRTQDNAVLSIILRYKWRFKVDKDHPEKLFKIKDFIGFATETMAGIIRNEAAKHTFEAFHSSASEIIKKTLFTADMTKPYTFDVNGFEIFDIDIKKISPEDADIAKQLNAAIKSNMDVYVKKIEQQAKLEAEKSLIEGQQGIEAQRTALIKLKQENTRTENIGLAQIEAERNITIAKAKAEAIQIEEDAKIAAETKRIQEIIKALASDEKSVYTRLKQLDSLSNIEKTVVVPSDAKLFLPMGDILNK